MGTDRVEGGSQGLGGPTVQAVRVWRWIAGEFVVLHRGRRSRGCPVGKIVPWTRVAVLGAEFADHLMDF